MRIYLAGRYSRRLELAGYADQLREAGHTVTSRWLAGNHHMDDDGNPMDDLGNCLPEAEAVRNRWAMEDFTDVIMADLVIHFTEPARASASRGGRHVEMGVALGRMLQVWIVGPRENLFCWLDDVRHFETFADAMEVLRLR